VASIVGPAPKAKLFWFFSSEKNIRGRILLPRRQDCTPGADATDAGLELRRKMLTEPEVIELYRSLLGRAPENAGTIKAFQTYYPSYERGRKAVFDSNEFQIFYASVTGRAPHGTENIAAAVALSLLLRAGAIMPAPPSVTAENPDLRSGLRTLFRNQAKARLAVVIGESAAVSLNDLVPLEQEDAAILQVAPGFPPVVPLTSTLRGGTTLFRLAADAASLSAFLQAAGRRIDALFLLARPAGPEWVSALRGQFAAQTLVAVGPEAENFPASRISAAIEAAHPAEPVHDFAGLRLHHVGGWLLPVSYAAPAAQPALPDRGAYPRLALAAIMRDEAVCIENMLRSVLPVASYVALLDTGSTDRTVAIARDVLGASGVPFAIREGFRDAFNEDFSAMRNAATDMVPDDIPWVLMLDADEELVAEDYAPLLELIALGAHDAYALPRYNFPGDDKQGQVTPYPDRQIRLFRHTPERRIRYAGAVHETIRDTPGFRVPLDASAIGGAKGGPHIHHLVRRFRTPEEEERKQAFYKRIARERGA
jgi:hypothetical protein